MQVRFANQYRSSEEQQTTYYYETNYDMSEEGAGISVTDDYGVLDHVTINTNNKSITIYPKLNQLASAVKLTFTFKKTASFCSEETYSVSTTNFGFSSYFYNARQETYKSSNNGYFKSVTCNGRDIISGHTSSYYEAIDGDIYIETEPISKYYKASTPYI